MGTIGDEICLRISKGGDAERNAMAAKYIMGGIATATDFTTPEGHAELLDRMVRNHWRVCFDRYWLGSPSNQHGYTYTLTKLGRMCSGCGNSPRLISYAEGSEQEGSPERLFLRAALYARLMEEGLIPSDPEETLERLVR